MSLKFETEGGDIVPAVLVHHPEQEGALIVATDVCLTNGSIGPGMILTPIAERPDWAAGYAVALLHEHRHFWTSRLGTYAMPELFAAPDLSWVGIDEESGEECEFDADADYRMDLLAERLGVDRETGDILGATAEHELSFQHFRTAEEASAIEKSQEEGFAAVASR